MDSSYLRAVSMSALQGLLTATWIAAAELPVAKRRVARVSAVAALSAVASIGDRPDPAPPEPAGEEGDTVDDAKAATRSLVLTAVVVGGSVAMIMGRRRFERRWLEALTRDGHPHPHRSLAIRMGLLSVAATLPGRLIKVREARRAAG
jgi:hypothetical protein